MVTPCYIVDYKKFKNNCLNIMNEFSARWNNNVIYGYSVKTNRYEGLIQYAYNELNWKIETVSLDEYRYCEGIGIDPKDIILNGPCKKRGIEAAIKNGSIINLDNYDEVVEFSRFSNCTENLLVGLRVNFDLENVCPGQTTAGKEVSRFGFDSDSEEFAKAINVLKKSGKKIGLHMHTSTHTRSTDVFSAICDEVIRIVRKYQIDLEFIDIGGGFFGGQILENKPSMKEYSEIICDKLKVQFNPAHTKLILEPGAAVLATCVRYATKVINVRDIRGSRIVTLDGTILHINPFMVKRNQSYELQKCLDRKFKGNREVKRRQIVCGSTCMENDRIVIVENKEELEVGDVLYFQNVGAYTMAFNSFFIFNPPGIIDERED